MTTHSADQLIAGARSVDTTEAWCRWTFEGWHRWLDATPARRYLSHPHRHIFHAEARITVEHHDREVEFHDLLDECKVALNSGHLPKYDAVSLSCEMMALQVVAALQAKWPNRPVTVTVSEDNENGATVTCK